MTEISVTIEDSNEEDQINDVREEYITGDLSDEELEERIEAALSEGAPIGNGGIKTDSESTTFIEDIGIWFSWGLTKPFLRLLKHQSDDGDFSAKPSENYVHIVNHDPDPDDHPAESAGTMSAILALIPGVYYILFGLAAGFQAGSAPTVLNFTLNTAMIVLCVIGFLALHAPKPTVKVTDKGVGTHVAN